jgi:hypothetical protein
MRRPHLAGEALPASCPLLAGDELVRPTEEDLGGQVPAKFATKRAFNGDGLKRRFIPTSGHIAAAPLAGDDEQSPLDSWESECHSLSIGEYEAKICTDSNQSLTP